MNWQAWVQMLGAAIGVMNPATGAVVSMIVNGVLSLDAAKTEDQALAAQWFQFCKTAIVDENRDFTQEEHDAAKAFADSVHAANQAA